LKDVLNEKYLQGKCQKREIKFKNSNCENRNSINQSHHCLPLILGGKKCSISDCYTTYKKRKKESKQEKKGLRGV